jgi:hypothetical protein
MIVDGDSVSYHVFSPAGRKRFDLAGLWKARLAKEYSPAPMLDLLKDDLDSDESYLAAVREQESLGNPATAEDDILSGYVDDAITVDDEYDFVFDEDQDQQGDNNADDLIDFDFFKSDNDDFDVGDLHSSAFVIHKVDSTATATDATTTTTTTTSNKRRGRPPKNVPRPELDMTDFFGDSNTDINLDAITTTTPVEPTSSGTKKPRAARTKKPKPPPTSDE